MKMSEGCRDMDRETAKRRCPTELDTEFQRNHGTGAEEKVHRGNVLVEKYVCKSEDTFYTVSLGNRVKVDFFSQLHTGPGGICEQCAIPVPFKTATLRRWKWASVAILTITPKEGVQRTQEGYLPEWP